MSCLPVNTRKVEFSGQIIPQVMEIPRSAIFNSNEVFIVVDGKLRETGT